MYEVRTERMTWQYIVKYHKWKLDPNFMQFTFNDKKILILPISQIKSIQQVSIYPYT